VRSRPPNVDLAQEIITMITARTVYQALRARVISTANNMEKAAARHRLVEASHSCRRHDGRT